MKKNTLRIISLVLCAVLVLGTFSGCASKKKNIKIGLAAPAVTHGWLAGVAYYAEKYCKANGVEYKLTTSANADEMAKSLNELADWGAQAIVLWPQWQGMETAVDEIIKKGISVVGFDVDIASKGIYKVTGNNYDMGYECARYIVDKVGDGADIAVMDVPSAGSVSELRKEGFYNYFAENDFDTSGVFEISGETFSRDAGYADMKKVLSEHKNIDAVFSLDDETSIGVVKAVLESGRTEIKAVTGGGGMQEYFKMIADKSYSSLGLASALYSPAMIEDAIKTAVSIGSGEPSSKLIVIPTNVVTAENVSSYIDSQNTIY